MINDCQKYIDNSEICGCLALDLSRAFDMINHDILLSKLCIYGINNEALKWFSSYLDNRTQRIKLDSHMSQREKINYGVPQGSILGPLLFVLYINDLPCIVKHCDIDMYADDTSLKSHGLSILDVSEKLQNDCRLIEIWLRNNLMVVNTSKSKSMAICSYQKRASLESDIIQLNFEGTELEQVDECKILGLLIDENLSFKPQIDRICSKISSFIGLLYRIRPFVDRKCLILFYNSFILPLIDYWLNIWFSAANVHIQKVQVLQNRAARAILNVSYDTSSAFMLKELNIMSVKNRGIYQTCLLKFKVLNCEAPEYLNVFNNVQNANYVLRSNDQSLLEVPKAKTETFKKSFSYSGAALWNSLPKNIKDIDNICEFKVKLKAWLLRDTPSERC